MYGSETTPSLSSSEASARQVNRTSLDGPPSTTKPKFTASDVGDDWSKSRRSMARWKAGGGRGFTPGQDFDSWGLENNRFRQSYGPGRQFSHTLPVTRKNTIMPRRAVNMGVHEYPSINW